MKSAVITGATGMIGCSLIEYLVNEGIKITAIIRPQSIRRAMIPNHHLINVVECELNNLSACNTESIGNADAFFHLAWEGTVGESRNDCYLQNNNVRYTLDAVALSKRLNCSTFVFAGSQAEFGRVDGLLSSSLPSKPENAYGVAKYSAELMSKMMCNSMDIKHTTARILSVYGPNDGENTMVSSTIRKLLRGEDTAFTPCLQKWDYLYCKDAAKALYLIALKGNKDAVYCLGSGKATELKYYVETIRDMINTKVELGIGKVPYGKNQVMMLCANIEDLRNDLGFEPEYSFERGIEETINWWRERI